MQICGLQKLAMVDFPEKLAATVFTGGCNLRCPFCHNALLVNRLSENPERYSEADVLTFLKSRRGLLDGVVLSGGEPLLTDGAADFLQAVRDMGYAVKLDTNGCYPAALADILERRLADYVAMDIKNCREKYGMTVGLPEFDPSPIDESLRLLKDSGVDYELRTTVIKELHTADDILSIARWCSGAPRYYLQNFVDSGNLVGTGCSGVEPLELQAFADIARPYFGLVETRGI